MLFRSRHTGGKEDSPHRRKGGLTGGKEDSQEERRTHRAGGKEDSQEERRTHRRKGHRMGEFLEKLEMRELINDGGNRKEGRRDGQKELAA